MFRPLHASVLLLALAPMALAPMALAPLALADEAYPVVKANVDVAYGDLDLSTASGAETMLSRLRHSARLVCGGMAERDRFYRTNPEFVDRQFRGCVQQAVQGAVTRLNRPQLTNVFAARSPAPDKVAKTN